MGVLASADRGPGFRTALENGDWMMFSTLRNVMLAGGMVAGVTLAAGSASAQTSMDFFQGAPYVSVTGAFVMPEDGGSTGIPSDVEYGSGYSGNVALGWLADNGLRAEVEFGYFEFDVNGAGPLPWAGGEAEVFGGMANIYYEFPFNDRYHPYVGGGIGFHSIDVEGAIASGSDEVFGYQGIGGIAIDLTPNVALITEYRYFGLDDANLGGADIEFTTHKFQGGFRFSF